MSTHELLLCGPAGIFSWNAQLLKHSRIGKTPIYKCLFRPTGNIKFREFTVFLIIKYSRAESTSTNVALHAGRTARTCWCLQKIHYIYAGICCTPHMQNASHLTAKVDKTQRTSILYDPPGDSTFLYYHLRRLVFDNCNYSNSCGSISAYWDCKVEVLGPPIH